jgi:hypothetical protein
MTLQTIADLFSGNQTKKTLLFVSLPLIWLSYFGTLAIAVHLSAKTYNWRHTAISKLLYPRNDPEFHSIASFGVAVAGLLMIPFAGYICRTVRSASPLAADIGAWAFGAGAACLILAGLIVSHPYRGSSAFPRLHEMLARSSAVALGAGMFLFWICAVKGYSAVTAGKIPHAGGLLVSWSVLALPAMMVVALRLAAHAHFGWSNPVYQALENPRVWHLGLWEWLGSAAVFLFLLSAALFLPERAAE